MRKRPWLIAALGVVAMLEGTTYAQPDNDECFNAAAVACDTIVVGTTEGAGVDDNAPDCTVGITSPGVWYSIVGTGGIIEVNTCQEGTTYDTKLTIYSGGCDGLTCVADNDDGDGCDNFASRVTFSSEEGVEYLILVHGFGGASGDFEMETICEAVFEDCNGNGIPDDEDIENGTSTDCNGNGIPDECEFDVFEFEFEDLNLAIPDDDPNGVTDTQNIQMSGEIADVNVGVVIDHTFLGDLIIDVEHNATSVRLWDRQCSSSENMDVIFDDEGDPVICGTPTIGTYRPVESLTAYDGQDLFGDWSITVSDNAPLDIGSLISWKLIIGIPRPICCEGTLLSSDTIPHGGIDAREEHEFGDPNDLTGLSAFVFTFDDSSTVVSDCFEVAETGGGTPPNVVSVDDLGNNQVQLNLDRAITAGQWTTVGYNSINNPSLVDIGFLPGDVNQSEKSTGADITELIDCLNEQIVCADYQTDIDRSGLSNGNDITRLIDVLQSSDQDPFSWLNQELPDQPNP